MAAIANSAARQETLDALEVREAVLRENADRLQREIGDAEGARDRALAQLDQKNTVLGKAQVRSEAQHPQWHYAVGGVGAALLAAFALAFLLERFDRVLLSAKQVHQLRPNLPVLGSVKPFS